MKKSLLLASIAALGFSGATYAAHVSPEEALQRLKATSNSRKVAGKFKAAPKFHSTVGNLYVYTTSEGYMILPDNDEAPALLAYSENADFTAKGNPGLEYWLDYYNRELSYLNSQKGLKKAPVEAKARPSRKPIAPLTETRWNQGAPYNDMCPLDNGARSVTGCVATAMAQVMKYHNYPEKGKGTHSYLWETGNKTLSFDYGNTTFDWANMTNTYGDSSTDEQKKAVATLMYACGVSVDMGYTSNESSASTITMGQSFLEYFDYDKGLWMPMRDYYGLYDWEDMIYADLEKGLPVLYAGQGTAGGHQFICDGYSEDGYFHFNWGWGGMSDGYFLLTALNPASLGIGGGAGGFNSGQQIALGVQPPKADSKPVYLMYCTSDFAPNTQEVSAGEDLGCSGNFSNFSMSELPSGTAMGMRIVSADGSYDKYLESHSVAGLPTGYGYNADVIKFPLLPDGTYTIKPAFYDGKDWKEMPTPIGGIGSIEAQVTDGTAILSSPQVEAELSVSNINAPSSIYIGRDFPLTFSVTNNGEEEFVGEIIPVLFDSNENLIAESVYIPLDVLAGQAQDITDYIGKFSSTAENTLQPGTYYLDFINKGGRLLGEPIEISLMAAPTSTKVGASDFKLISESLIINADEVKFGFKVSCTEGYFTNRFDVVIFPDTYGEVRSVASGSSEMLYLSSGESTEATASLNLSNLENGKYFAMLYLGRNEAINTQIKFEINVATGINEIQGGNENKVHKIYNMQGQPCQEPLSPGLYIIDGKKVMVK
ncbi:MAG: C10 family peptidase [Muribaculaceae bacterium]|nr:C10 family peptidase [Muribaculaceae bacterium]